MKKLIISTITFLVFFTFITIKLSATTSGILTFLQKFISEEIVSASNLVEDFFIDASQTRIELNQQPTNRKLFFTNITIKNDTNEEEIYNNLQSLEEDAYYKFNGINFKPIAILLPKNENPKIMFQKVTQQ